MKDVEEKCGRFYRNNPQYLDSIPDGQSHGFLWEIELRMIPYYSILQLQPFENSDSHHLLPKRTTTNISLVTQFSEAQTIAGAAACILVLGPQVAFGCCTGNAIRHGNWRDRRKASWHVSKCILKISQNHGLNMIFHTNHHLWREMTWATKLCWSQLAPLNKPLGAAGRGSAVSRCC